MGWRTGRASRADTPELKPVATKSGKAGSPRPTVSVIIGFRDWGFERLERAVATHRACSIADQVEVVISDFGSTDTETMRSLCERHGCTLVRTEAERWSRSQALNRGISQAAAPWIVVTDADMLVAPRTIEIALRQAEAGKPAVRVLQCRDLDENAATADGAIDWNTIERQSTLRSRWATGGFVLFSRRDFDRIRGFDERMLEWGGEDNDFVKRMRGIGRPLLWVDTPDTAIYHIWHAPVSRDLSRAEGFADANRKMLENDASLARNLTANVLVRPAIPIVSIVIATRNRADLLRESIASCLEQTVPDFEIIVVDDASEDATEHAVASFDDARIRYVRLPERSGVAAARNHGNALAKGAYIAVHDDDDLMLPDRLETQLASIKAGDVGSYGGWIDFTGGELSPFPGKAPLEMGSSPANALMHGTIMIRTDVALAVKYETAFSRNTDFDWTTRLLTAGFRLRHCEHYVLLRRWHASNMTLNAAYEPGYRPAQIARAVTQLFESTAGRSARVAKSQRAAIPIALTPTLQSARKLIKDPLILAYELDEAVPFSTDVAGAGAMVTAGDGVQWRALRSGSGPADRAAAELLPLPSCRTSAFEDGEWARPAVVTPAEICERLGAAAVALGWGVLHDPFLVMIRWERAPSLRRDIDLGDIGVTRIGVDGFEAMIGARTREEARVRAAWLALHSGSVPVAIVEKIAP
jgi:glycosyltransferase involved in cell wall biosynthesis